MGNYLHEDMHIYEGIHVSELGKTKDEVLIKRIIADDDEDNKLGLLYHNPNLTDAHFQALVQDSSTKVREALVLRKSLPADVLDKLRSDSEESIRVKAVCHSQSENKYFVEAVLRGKLSPVAKEAFCSNVKAVSNFEVFKALWNSGKKSQVPLMWALYAAAGDRTDTTDSSHVLYDVAPSSSPIDPKVLTMLHDLIRKDEASNAVKAVYARVSVALPELLDTLKDYPYKPVIDAIALNRSAWVSTHEYIYAHQRTTLVTSSIAWATRDNELLNRIYHRTKSNAIRWAVENNPAFVCLNN